VSFSRGHIHQILTNPLYAGRIRHRKVVHEGQHPALIDPARWDRVQLMLQDGATKERRTRSKTTRSLLCGKLFDETGDRLTPSHSKTRAGKRLRYYVSHRLIAKSGEDRDGWRLPAAELEQQVATMIHKHMAVPSFATSIQPEVSADAIGRIKTYLTDWLAKAERKTKTVLKTVKDIKIAPGRISIQLDRETVTKLIRSDDSLLSEDALSISCTFQLRKRGVETKLIFADHPTGQDDTLIRNIAKAHMWFDMIKAGQSFDQIAEAEQTSKRRIQQMIDLAFLAPDIIRDVLDGKQPVGFTSDWCLRHILPSDWSVQRALISTL